MIQALIFDFDGTLFHIEQIHQESIRSVVEEYCGTSVDPDELRAHAGIPYLDRITHMLALRDITDPAIAEQLEPIARKRAAEQMQDKHAILTQGAANLITEAHAAGITLAIVSSATRARIEEDIAGAEIADFFSFIIAVEDVANRKPHPEPYLKALERLNISAAEAVVFEDSPTGAQSAHDAGIPVIGLKTTLTERDLGVAAFTIHDFTEISLKEIQQRLGSSA